MAIPLYAFVQGDTLGLLIVVHEDETVKTLIERTFSAANVRVPAFSPAVVRYHGEKIAPDLTVAEAGFEALERFDLVKGDTR